MLTFNYKNKLKPRDGYAVSNTNMAYLLADFDNDKKMDLVHLFDTYYHFWKGRGDGTFEVSPQIKPTVGSTSNGYGVGNSNTAYLLADFDKDGTPDLLHLGGSYYHFWKGKGDGNFEVSPQIKPTVGSTSDGYGVGNSNTAYLLADFDKDGTPDLLHLGGSYYHFWKGKGDGNFEVSQQIKPTAGSTSDGYGVGNSNTAYLLADFNNDGFPDLLHLVGSYYHFWKGKGDGTFEVSQQIKPTVGSTSNGYGVGDSNTAYLLADFNKDGTPDLLHLGGSYFRFWKGNGDGTFEISKTKYKPEAEYSISNNNINYILIDFEGKGTTSLMYFSPHSIVAGYETKYERVHCSDFNKNPRARTAKNNEDMQRIGNCEERNIVIECCNIRKTYSPIYGEEYYYNSWINLIDDNKDMHNDEQLSLAQRIFDFVKENEAVFITTTAAVTGTVIAGAIYAGYHNWNSPHEE